MGLNMQKLHLIISACLVFTASYIPCHAVPSLLCVPKAPTSEPETDDKKPYQVTTKKIRIYYVNGQHQWQAKVLVRNGEVKAILFSKKRNRPFATSEIDSKGFGSGIDFRGQPWEFHGFLD